TGERVVRLRGDAFEEPLARSLERAERVAKLCSRGAEGRIVRDLDPLDGRVEFFEQRPHRCAAVGGKLAGDEIDRLDTVGALIDRGDARVAGMLRGAGFLDEAHA